MTQDSKYGQLDEYCRGKRVFPVSPNTFYACLSAVAISLQGQKIEENARHLLAGMAGLKKQFETFRGRVRKARNASAARATELRGSGQPAQPSSQFARANGAGRVARSVFQNTHVS